jgi:hypothetical protein
MTYEVTVSFRGALDEMFSVWAEDVGVLVTCAVRVRQVQKYTR